jgi:hypothetical protein
MMLQLLLGVALAIYTLYVVGCPYDEWVAAGRPRLEEL